MPGVTDVRDHREADQLLEPLPEAGSYLGFIFARGATALDAERPSVPPMPRSRSTSIARLPCARRVRRELATSNLEPGTV